MEEKKIETVKEEKKADVKKVDFQNSSMVENGLVDLINGNFAVVREEILTRDGRPLQNKDGNPLYSYVVNCKIRGRAMKINLSSKAQDGGAYALLDIIFSISDKAELIIGEESMSDNNGKVTYYPTYTVHVREDNIDYDCSVRLPRASDRSLLAVLQSSLKAAEISAEKL